MFNFFTKNENQGGCYKISGCDYNHIKNVLRMEIGERLLVSNNAKSDLCEILEFKEDVVLVKVLEENYQNTELPLKIYLFQGLPKSDKMELIIQKCVELGVFAIAPVEMSRCVVKLDDKKKKSKTERWQAISESAAKQSKRNIIPKVYESMSYKNAFEIAKELDLILVPYENEEGMLATKKVLNDLKSAKSVGIFIGSEGGFDESEIEFAKNSGSKIISLGSRILRTETAAITAVGMCMLNSELEEG